MQEAIDYYRKKYGADKTKALLHLMKELGEVAGAHEKGNRDVYLYDLAECAGLLAYLSELEGVNLAGNVASIYKKKLEKQ